MGLRNVQYGTEIVEEIAGMLPADYVVVTMPEPWEVVAPRWGREPEHKIEVGSMDERAVSQLEERLPSVDAVLGVGGGAVMDMAKYIHWKRDITLYLIPTIASVDAAVTSSVAVRKGGKVRYIGEADPVVVGVDFPVVQSAPIHLNRAGVGDILSIHTALWDWRFSHGHGEDPYSEEIAAASAGMLERMTERPSDMRDVTEDGIQLLFDLYNEVNDICEAWGNSRPEEGSEHFFAYNVEYITGQHFVHGELVCLGVYVLSYIQGNDPEWVHEFINEVGVRYRMDELDISEEAFRETLLTLRDYAEREDLFYSVINETEFDEDLVDQILTDLDIR